MGNWDRMDLGAFWFIFPVLIGTALLGLGAVFLHLRAQKHQWISYQLVIDKKGITRHQLKRPSIHIQKEAMRDVLVHENGTLEIRSRYTDGSPIYIPPALLGFDEVRKLLTAEWSVPMYPVNEAP
ncbi:hypothetical protein SAMN05421823_105318 [Catalinimonas alkaloidigena]|uniref:Uncharacterized protein n=2 Tax=Catalinimonas alkaloidigena TaxID=1075417 RepID=A0A1G9JHZ9_9BACT|nr:hypothetical protein SAMN05421823_105318 [Catalinimonas alkaloidigena]